MTGIVETGYYQNWGMKLVLTYFVPSDRALSASPDAALGKNCAIVALPIVVTAMFYRSVSSDEIGRTWLLKREILEH